MQRPDNTIKTDKPEIPFEDAKKAILKKYVRSFAIPHVSVSGGEEKPWLSEEPDE